MSEAVCGESSTMREVETNTESGEKVNPELPPSPAQTPSSPEFAAANQPSYAHDVFFDADGLRPGWGIAFYALMFLTLQWLAVHLAASRDLGASGLWNMMLEEAGNLCAALIPAVILRRIEQRPWRVYGLPASPAFGKRFWAGAVWGFAGISVLLFALLALGGFEFGHVVLHGARLAKFAAFWAVLFLLVGLFEEFWLRGYSQFTLTRGIGFWPAAVALSCGFGLIHLRNEGEHWNGALGAAVIGLFFCLTLRRTGSLWFAVGFHAAWDWGLTFFYSVPDSGTVWPGHLLNSSLHGPHWLTGGSVGPEGSLLCFVVIALLWVAFARLYPGDRHAPDLAQFGR
jgi:uncharacterized protein